MLKKMMIIVFLSGFLIHTGPDKLQAEEHTTFLQFGGGVFANRSEVEEGRVHPTFKLEGLQKTYKNIYVGTSYQNMNAGEEMNTEDVKLNVTYFTRNLNDPVHEGTPQLFFTAGNGWSHIADKSAGGTTTDEWSYGAGAGLLFPFGELSPSIQFMINQVGNETYFTLGLAVLTGVDVKR